MASLTWRLLVHREHSTSLWIGASVCRCIHHWHEGNLLILGANSLYLNWMMWLFLWYEGKSRRASENEWRYRWTSINIPEVFKTDKEKYHGYLAKGRSDDDDNRLMVMMIIGWWWWWWWWRWWFEDVDDNGDGDDGDDGESLLHINLYVLRSYSVRFPFLSTYLSTIHPTIYLSNYPSHHITSIHHIHPYNYPSIYLTTHPQRHEKSNVDAAERAPFLAAGSRLDMKVPYYYLAQLHCVSSD